MYKLHYSKEASKTLLKAPVNIARTIRSKLEALETNPYQQNNNATRLQGLDEFRLRIGDYRAIYKIINKKLIILVLEINTRGGVYK